MACDCQSKINAIAKNNVEIVFEKVFFQHWISMKTINFSCSKKQPPIIDVNIKKNVIIEMELRKGTTI